MSSFLELSACKGRRPEHVSVTHLIGRPDLIAKLLRERHVARFLTAPTGFGKTSLVFEYAETVFAFAHVFWINGRSPCFLRDLDSGIVSPCLRELDSEPFLAVFEDVPRLDAARVEQFSRVIDDLLEAGNEVVVTCVPSSDAYADSHRDRMKLDASDLLLSEAECKAATTGSQGRRTSDTYPRAQRIAGLRWGGDDGTKLLAGVMDEELPGDVLLALFSMVALREGSWSDLSAFLSAGIEGDLVDLLAEGYPFLGIDRHDESYAAFDVSMATVASAFDGIFGKLAERSLFDGREALAWHFADALLARAAGQRACELMAGLASKASCASWLAARSRALLRAGCVKPAHDLHVSTGRVRGVLRWELAVDEAWRLYALDDEQAALSAVRRMAFSTELDDGVRAGALLVAMQAGSAEMRVRAAEDLRGLLQASEAVARVGASDASLEPVTEAAFWMPLARVLLATDAGAECGMRTWTEVEAAGSNIDALMLAAAHVFKAASGEVAASRGKADSRERLNAAFHMAARVRDLLEDAASSPLDLFSAAAERALEQACETGAVVGVVPPSSGVSLEAHRVELSLFAQRAAYRRTTAEHVERKASFRATHPDVYRDERRTAHPRTTMVAPTLHVNLFGGLEVRLGDDPVDPRLMRRQKTRTLLALLVLSRGKELARDRLVRSLWPDSALDAARKNFYSVWSQLRRALTTPSGACPYLVRGQTGCRIDARLVDSDVARFEALTRTLLFGRPEADEWEPLFAQVSGWYADDLLPGESECELIGQMRDEYRVHLVDALVAASVRLVEAGEVCGGLWFAREALKHDKSREDAYTALMEAQIAAGQRTAALETYFACRGYLADELGIDPSLHTVRLYRDIIEAEESMEW